MTRVSRLRSDTFGKYRFWHICSRTPTPTLSHQLLNDSVATSDTYSHGVGVEGTLLRPERTLPFWTNDCHAMEALGDVYLVALREAA
jgi:hypothetical protein